MQAGGIEIMGRSMTDNTVSAASYGGAAVSVIFGLTLTDWGVIVGILTAIVTFGFNIGYRIKQDRRDQARHDLEMQNLRLRRRDDPKPEPIEEFDHAPF